MSNASATFCYTPIGTIHSPFTAPAGTPIQPVYSTDTPATVELFPAFRAGLADVDGFDRLWLIYAFDRAPAAKLTVVPFRDTVERGIFATRAPCRPNPIGMSVVRLLSVDRTAGLLQIAGIDVLDGTPLLDIKPYCRDFDVFPDGRCGWQDAAQGPAVRTHADNRFKNPR